MGGCGMNKLVFVIMIFSTLSILGACKDQSLEEVNIGVDQEQAVYNEKVTKLTEEMSQNVVWSKAYDKSQLHHAVEQQIKRWLDTDQAIPYYIQNNFDQNQTDVVGLFRSINDWELKGKTKEDQAFVLKSNEDIVTLEYDEYKEELSKAEFEFLIPLRHLNVLEELLSQNKYEFMKWTEKNVGWSVQVHSSTEPINEAFVQFLLAHLSTSDSIKASGFESYSLTYNLQVYAEEEQLVIKSLQFSLEKEGNILEQILFHF
jgi:lysyl-tRNA synthetase class II